MRSSAVPAFKQGVIRLAGLGVDLAASLASGVLCGAKATGDEP
jgi:hypothetical protein